MCVRACVLIVASKYEILTYTDRTGLVIDETFEHILGFPKLSNPIVKNIIHQIETDPPCLLDSRLTAVLNKYEYTCATVCELEDNLQYKCTERTNSSVREKSR